MVEVARLDGGRTDADVNAIKPPVSDPVAEKIRTFVPRSLPRELWESAGPAWKALVTRSQPTSADVATGRLSHCAALIAWAGPLAGATSPAALLKPTWVDRHVQHLQQTRTGRTVEQAQNCLRLLMRLQAAAGTVDNQAPRPTSDRGGGAAVYTQPYTEDELEQLRAVAALKPRWAGVLADLSRPLPCDTLAQDDRDRLSFTEAAHRRGLSYQRRRMRATSVLRALATEVPFAELCSTLAITSRDLQNVVPHLLAANGEDPHDLLRG